mmetsp:Transcript_96716/g.268874  ORF Transcript_96716/g.268874 Transcript_96716/m.268874 type:complete len:83 (+) Transcript_96716:420-668(+)
MSQLAAVAGEQTCAFEVAASQPATCRVSRPYVPAVWEATQSLEAGASETTNTRMQQCGKCSPRAQPWRLRQQLWLPAPDTTA